MSNRSLADELRSLDSVLDRHAMAEPDWNPCDTIRNFVERLAIATDSERRATYRAVSTRYVDALTYCSQAIAERAYSDRDAGGLEASILTLALAGYHTPSRFDTHGLDQFLFLPFDVASRLGLDVRELALRAAQGATGKARESILEYLDEPLDRRGPERYGWRAFEHDGRLSYRSIYELRDVTEL